MKYAKNRAVKFVSFKVSTIRAVAVSLGRDIPAQAIVLAAHLVDLVHAFTGSVGNVM